MLITPLSITETYKNEESKKTTDDSVNTGVGGMSALLDSYYSDDTSSNEATIGGVEMYYDGEQWVKKSDTQVYYENAPNSKIPSATPTSGTSPNSSADTSVSEGEGTASKEYKDIEYCTLEGELSLIPTPSTMKLRQGDTIYLVGVGRFLSGKYYITNVAREISSDGFTISITVIKTGFGDSLKKTYTKEDTEKDSDDIENEEVPLGSPSFKVGDKVKIVGKNAIYGGAHKGTPVPEWVKKKRLTIMKMSADGSEALLKEIFSWVYVEYLVVK